MIYLSGAVRDELRVVPNTGYMLTPHMGNRPRLDGIYWAADTGSFAQPERYSTEGYLRWLATLAEYRRSCLFVTAPDRFGDGAATLALARPVLPLIRAMGFPVALVLQPGMTPDEIPWSDIDCLFVGGPDWWQNSSAVHAMLDIAAVRGIWRHKGRVNSEQRLVAAAVAGYDSADGTYLAFGPDTNLPKLQRWMQRLAAQSRLWEAA